jgi:putative transposase
MTNHVHLLVTPETGDGISRMMQSLGRQYVRYFNYTYRRTGTLWEGRYKSCIVDSDEYLLICQRYIELNPVRAGMVDLPEEYRWSSYQANGLGKVASLWSPHQLYIDLGKSDTERCAAYQTLFKAHLDSNLINKIRSVTNKGMALGDDRFRKEIEKLTGRRVTALKRGPGPKKEASGEEFLL